MSDRLRLNLVYAARVLARSPLFALTAIVSLAIGIGANATIFAVVNGLLLLPAKGVAEPDRMVDIGRSTHGEGVDTVSYPTFADLRDRVSVFTGLYAYRGEPTAMSLGGPDGGERIFGEQVSGGYFEVLGVKPAMGAFFSAADEHLGTPLRRVVLAHAFWRQRFAADPQV